MDSSASRNMILWFFMACFIFSIVLLAWLLKPFLSIIVLAAVAAGIFYPVYRFLQKGGRISESFASFLTCVLVFIILFVPIVLFVGSLAQEAFDLYEQATSEALSNQIRKLLHESELIEKVNSFLMRFNVKFTGEQLWGHLSEMIRFTGRFLFDQARLIATNMVAFFINLFLMILVIYFLLIDGKRLISFIVEISPLPKEQEEILIDKFNEMAGAILIGNGLAGFIQGLLGGFMFYAFNLPSAFLWGVIMGILAFLPIIGIGIVLVPASIYLFLTGRVSEGIFFYVAYLILSFGTEYVFKPKLVGKRVKMHPLLVFFSIIGGLRLFGILGIIYGPLVVTAFLTLTEIYKASYQQLIESTES